MVQSGRNATGENFFIGVDGSIWQVAGGTRRLLCLQSCYTHAICGSDDGGPGSACIRDRKERWSAGVWFSWFLCWSLFEFVHYFRCNFAS